MTLEQIGDIAEGIAKIKGLIREFAPKHRVEYLEHCLKMLLKKDYEDGMRAIIDLINQVYESPAKRNEYTEYLFSAFEARKIL